MGILRHPLALLQRGKFRSVPEQCPATVPLPLQALHARHSSSQTPHFHGRTADWFGKQGQSFSPRDAFAAKGNPGWLSARSAAEHRRRSSTGRQGENAVVGMSPPRELRGRPGPKYARESSIRSAHSTKGGSRAGGALAEGASGEGEARARTQRGLRLSTECVRFDQTSAFQDRGADLTSAAQRMGENSLVTSLSVGCCEAADEFAAALGAALGSNSTLRTLNLWDNRIGAAGATALGKGMEQNSSLQDLNLRSNSLGPDGALGLAKGLMQPGCVLRTLHLRYNAIGDGGATALATMLLRNKSLAELDVSRNRVRSDGVDAIMKARAAPAASARAGRPIRGIRARGGSLSARGECAGRRCGATAASRLSACG